MMAITLSATGPAQVVIEVEGGNRRFGTGVAIAKGAHSLYSVPASSEAGTLVEVDVPLTVDARLVGALFEVIARPVPNARVSTFATITPSTGNVDSNAGAATVDFGALTTVAGIMPLGTGGLLPSLSAVSRWTGTGWAPLEAPTAFADTATQRLLLESSGATSDQLAASVGQLVGVGLPAVPPSLELQVDGRTVWFERQGSGPVEVEAPTALKSPGVRYVVDRTDAVREAFERALGAAGAGVTTVTVRIGLRSAAPGSLRLTPQVRSLRVFTVAFPTEGLAHSVDLPAEGVIDVDVTPPQARTVHEVALTVRGTFGPERVTPPVGPVIINAARLTLGVGRTVLIGLPRRLVEPFATLNGVRLLLAGSGQVTGRLLAAVAGTPGATPSVGEPVKGGDLTAVTVGAAGWTTLPLGAPVKAILPALPQGGPQPADDVAAWLELQPAYGEVECALTVADTHDDPPGGVLRRRLPGGGVTGLTEVPAIGPLRAAVRVVGLPDREHPLAAVTLSVAGAVERLPVTPASDDLAATLTLAHPVDAHVPVLLQAVCAAPGSLVLDTVRVTYTPQTSTTKEASR